MVLEEQSRLQRETIVVRDRAMTTSELTYPVLILVKGGGMHVATSEDMLTTLNSHFLRRRGGFTGSILVDSSALATNILDTKFVSGKGRFWGYTIFLDRMVRVNLTLSDPFEMPLERVKRRVLGLLRSVAQNQDPEYWQEALCRITEAQSASELIAALLPDWDLCVIFR